jgi:hypothetical protein
MGPLGVQVWQRQRLSQRAWLDGEVAYWHEQLLGAPPLIELPTDKARPKQPTGKGARVHLNIPSNVVDRWAGGWDPM